MIDDADRDDPLLLEVAEAVASGSSVDWDAVERSAGTNSALRSAVADLRTIAQLATCSSDTDDPQPAKPLDAWGRLQIRRPLGQGRFGTVYLAWDPALECEVALKVMNRRDGSAAIINEARLLARVRHPNVVTVHGVDQSDAAVALRMEFVEGVSLRQAVATRGTFGAQEAALVGIDLCSAVAAVHKAGLLHRDIKAHNVMRETGGRIVLMDFGAGEVRTDDFETGRTRFGTPLYLAPEIFEGEPCTIASDIYSIGVLLFHLVTLAYPVAGETVEEVIEAHRRDRVRLTDLRPDLPAAFVQVVERALERDPAKRYRTAGAMRQDLAATLDTSVATDTDRRLPPIPASRSELSVAVLPFVSLGPDQDIDYLCEGLAEELVIALGKLNGVRVMSRTATKWQQLATEPRRACRELGIDVLLEGTVRKSGDRLRISTQLVNGNTGDHIWSEGYSRTMEDVLGVQEGIAQTVVDKLQVTLAPVQARLTREHTQNPNAYHLYQKGRFYWTRRYQTGLLTALDYFKRAIKEDAGYALAYAGVADAYSLIGFYSIARPADAFDQARIAVGRALEIDPTLADAHASRALLLLGGDWDFPEAERELREAIRLDPKQALPRIYLAWVRVLRGDPSDGIAEARAAESLAPTVPLVRAGVAFALYLSRRYHEGEKECDNSLEFDSNFVLAMHFKAMCLAQQGRLAEAIALSEQTVNMSGRAPFYLGLLGHFCARANNRQRVDSIIDELHRIAASERYVPPHCFAYIYAGLNDLDHAFEWQAKAFADGASPFNFFSPVISNMQRDPRHDADMRRMGLKL